MSFLQNTALLQSLSLNHGHGSETTENCGKQQAIIQSKSSIANLIQFVRNPVENVGEAFEYWCDGYTTEERIQKQEQDDRKQILYLKLRTVCPHLYMYVAPPLTSWPRP
jgi:hypothetical protein